MALKEIESIIFSEISRKTTRIIPIITDRSLPPSYLMNYQSIDFSRDVNYGLEKLRVILSDKHTKAKTARKATVKKDYISRNESFITNLKRALKSGELTLVLGAGVSIGANIPSWNELLLDLLETMMKQISND